MLYLGRALRTKETLPDFHEKCRVTRHSRVFRGLTGSQRTPGFLGRHSNIYLDLTNLDSFVNPKPTRHVFYMFVLSIIMFRLNSC